MKALLSHPLSVTLFFVFTFVLTACPGSVTPPSTGGLVVTVEGLPTGVDASVSATGPGGYSQTITRTTTLTSLSPGEYLITAVNVTAGGATYEPTQASRRVTVLADATATATVTYAERVPDSGSLNVTITGLPEGVSASATVTGPNNFNQTVTSGQTLDTLTPGTYTVSASNVTSGDDTYVPDPLSQEVTVVPSATVAAAINYVQQTAGTGNLAVTISGVPTNASVAITGPGGFNENVTSSRTLPNLPPGDYTITATNVSSGGNVYTPSPAMQTATVSAGATATTTVSYSVQPGTLQINITGLPAGVNAEVGITGPRGFNQNVTATTPLPGLTPGAYTISAGNVTSDDGIYIPSPTQQTASVSSNATATATINYVLQAPSTGSLTITVTGLPEGASADVTVTGPGDVDETITETDTLPNLTPGDYTVTASTVTANGNSYVPAPTTTTVTVTAGSIATVNITYAVEPQSGTIVVNSLADPGAPTCTSEECTLRAALTAAQPGDRIGFASNLSGTIMLTAGQLEIDKNLTIDGDSRITIDAQKESRSFSTSAIVVLEGLTMKNGYVPLLDAIGPGAGVSNSGSLTLIKVIIAENYAGVGGGIYNASGGTVTLINTVVSDNKGGYLGRGAGIYNASNAALNLTDSTVSGNNSLADIAGGIYNAGTTTLANSTVSENTALHDGGGIYNDGGTLTITNSTIAGNTTDDSGGGIYNTGSLNITNSTIAGNHADSIGGGINSTAPLTLNSSIVTMNTAGMGSNILGVVNGNHNIIGGDPGLELDADGKPELADNGGPTKNIALLEGSPAINAIPVGTNGCGTPITTDQRGVSRPQGSGCDIGAYEYVLPVPPVLTIFENGALNRRTGVATASGTIVNTLSTLLILPTLLALS